jgi:predicted nucleic-acid-binding protein
MTGLDTNILVRFFAKDDLEQGRRTVEFLGSLTPEASGFVSLVSLVELVWVMRSRYRMDKAKLIECLERLLDSPELIVEHQETVSHALRRFASSKADFADCLIERSGYFSGCRETVTFDLSASRFAGMRLL